MMSDNTGNISSKSLVFILGCQRSGTTWLANIFDSSPDTLLFMEPFAPGYKIFPEFPATTIFLENSTSALDYLLKVDMPARIYQNKALLFDKSKTDARLFLIELRLSKLFNRFGKFVPRNLQERIRKFQLLNLNRIDKNYPIYSKCENPAVWVIKELRLAGKIPILLNTFPDAHYIVIMRHPAATIHSILRLFEKGKLGELRGDMDTYIETIAAQAISERYADLINRCREGSLVHKLALYWRISYETMYKKLEDQSSATFLIYEQLARDPLATIEQVFDPIGEGLVSDSVKEYLTYSSTQEVEKPRAITTVRKSATYYRAWEQKIYEDTQQAVLDITGSSFLMSYFDEFYM